MYAPTTAFFCRARRRARENSDADLDDMHVRRAGPADDDYDEELDEEGTSRPSSVKC